MLNFGDGEIALDRYNDYLETCIITEEKRQQIAKQYWKIRNYAKVNSVKINQREVLEGLKKAIM